MLRTQYLIKFSSRCHLCGHGRRYKQTKASKWRPVIGLEIHAQILAASKLFSGAATSFAAPVNQQVAALDAALPGTLPVLNRVCVEAGVKTALALNCNINTVSYFDRKHYFYADLPAGYQITQQRQALGVGGSLTYMLRQKDGTYEQRTARLTQLQLEQDSGKSIHDEEMGRSLIDLNRAGVGLMEIVTEPDFHSGEEAAAFVRELQLVLIKLGTCDGKMEEGSLRVDASVSVHQKGEPLGTRSEVKNINSVRWVASAIEYEIKRQIALLEKGGTVDNDTRMYNPATKTTTAMRDKERLHDYRFMPEPNLPPLVLYHRAQTMDDTSHQDVTSYVGDEDQRVYIDDVYQQIPPLPADIRHKLMESCNLRTDYAVTIVNEDGLYEYFEAILEHCNVEGNVVANFLVNRMISFINDNGESFVDCPIPADYIAEVLQLTADAQISKKHAFQVVLMLHKEKCTRRPKQIAEDKEMWMITDEDVIRNHIKTTMERLTPKMLRQAEKGKERAIRTLCNNVMTDCDQRVDTNQLERLVKEMLKL